MTALVQAGDGLQHQLLHLDRQAGGEAVDVDLLVAQPLGLQVDMVPLALGELDDLVLDRRAVARADALDLSRVQGRQVQVLADDAADLGRGVAQVAQRRGCAPGGGCTWRRAAAARRRAGARISPSRCCRRAAASASRSSGAACSKPRSRMSSASSQGGRLVGPAGGVGGGADEDAPAQEGAGADHHRVGVQCPRLPPAARRRRGRCRTTMPAARPW